MIRDITIGQYYPKDSLIHSLDPRVKFICTMVYIISAIMAGTFVQFAVAGIFLLCVVLLSKVPLKFIIKGLKSIVFLLIITVSFNLFITQGRVLVQIWKLTITWEGLVLAIKTAIRIMLLIMGASIMTLTTTPNQLTDGLERIMRPLSKIHVPAHEIAMTISIALRFIPILLEETDKIMKAQIARGADFESGNLIKRAKSLVPLLVPLFVSAFRRASDLAMAMEARCYHGGEGRTKMKPLKYHKRDYISYSLVVVYLLVLLNSPWVQGLILQLTAR